MATPLQVELLEKLALKGIGTPEDISDFLSKNFSKQATNHRHEYENSVVLFLDEMESSNYIKPLYEYYGAWSNEYIEDKIVPIYKCHETDNKLWYYLTQQGHEYIKKQKFNWSLFWAIVGVFVAVFFGIIGYFTSRKDQSQASGLSNKPKQSIHPLQKTKDTTPKTSLGDSSHK